MPFVTSLLLFSFVTYLGELYQYTRPPTFLFTHSSHLSLSLLSFFSSYSFFFPPQPICYSLFILLFAPTSRHIRSPIPLLSAIVQLFLFLNLFSTQSSSITLFFILSFFQLCYSLFGERTKGFYLRIVDDDGMNT